MFFLSLEFRQLCCDYFSAYLFLLLGSEHKNCVLLLSVIPGTSKGVRIQRATCEMGYTSQSGVNVGLQFYSLFNIIIN